MDDIFERSKSITSKKHPPKGGTDKDIDPDHFDGRDLIHNT